MPRKQVTVEVTALNQIEVKEDGHVTGWGEHASKVNVSGQVSEIIIKRNGKPSIGFKILENGSVVITGYDNSGFYLDLSRNVRLENNSPWEDETPNLEDHDDI